MKVLIINTSESKGGAAVAANRLMLALLSNGMQAKMLVRDKSTSNSNVTSVVNSRFEKLFAKTIFILERLQIFIENRFHKKNLFAISTGSTGFNITQHSLVKEADIIHLHWVNQGFLSVKEIGLLIKTGKPIIWTMHDMWPVTGICHYAGDCDNYFKDCGNCKFLKNNSSNDLSYQVFKKKKDLFSNAGIRYVACSQWLKQRGALSQLKTGNFFTSIPNPIDTNLFTPGDQSQARRELNLPQNKKLILFGALIASDKRKGLEYLIQATHLLADLHENVELVYFGEVKEEITAGFGLKTHSLGYISDSSLIIKMYQSADCFVIPSLEENLPNMIMESMSCGVPCVGFDVGGIPEMITHQKNGYVAQYKSSEDLALGIRTILAKSNDVLFKDTARKFVLENYSNSTVANRYIDLYKNVLKLRDK